MRVALQPASARTARQHYHDTIQRPVPLAALQPHLPPETMAYLAERSGGRPVPTWGVTPGENGVNARKWQRLAPGDCVLFSADGRIISSGIVLLKANSKPLAEQLWGRDENGQTWEYMYFLSDLTRRNISAKELGQAAQFRPGFRVQGFNIVNEEAGEGIRTAFELDASVPVGEENVLATLPTPTLEGELDRRVEILQRTEQDRIKRHLLRGRAVADCAICGRAVPVALLVAAHLKKRALCSESERRDLANVAMLMCALGCDDLYERGYLGVESGTVRVSPLLLRTPAIDDLMRLVDGRQVREYGKANQGYFEWHWNNIYKAAPGRS